MYSCRQEGLSVKGESRSSLQTSSLLAFALRVSELLIKITVETEEREVKSFGVFNSKEEGLAKGGGIPGTIAKEHSRRM